MNGIASKPRQIFVPDPVLGWRLSANRQIRVRFRPDITQTTDKDGWRTVLPTVSNTAHTVGFYGCSFTYGTSLDDVETYTSLLQSQFRQTRILNRGVGGHGTVQSYLNFRRDVLDGRVQAAVFCIIGDHKFRNMPHPDRMGAFLSQQWYEIGVEHVPCARLTSGGGIDIHYVPIWQPILKRAGLSWFLPDDVMLNMLTTGALNTIKAFADQNRIPIRIVLLDDLDKELNAAVATECADVTDISTSHDKKHRFLPHDIHPNTRANQLYADRLGPVLAELLAQSEGKS